MIEVTDATFEQDVLARSDEVPVVVDLWAPWCGPCKTLGPILEKVVGETDGKVALAKVNVDENPNISSAFRVQSIPAVYAIAGRQVVDSFIGALPEPAVREWLNRLAPPPSEADVLVAQGDEASLRKALEIDPGHQTAIEALSEMLVGQGKPEEALGLLARVPETAETRRIGALARLQNEGVAVDAGVDAKLDALLERVKADEEARQEYIDLLEAMGPEDPRTAKYRKALTSRLF